MAERTVTIKIAAHDSFSQVMRAYAQATKQAAQDTKDLDSAANNSGNGIENLAGKVNTLIGGFILAKGVGMAVELNNIGAAANRTEATFNALSGGVDDARSNLELMRQSTMGVVADTELMAGANKLFSMQLAQTGEDAAKMASVAVTLGRAMGEDAATAIQNFALMISNQSLLRLDSLGISSAAVRDRMKELADAFPDMDKQARFTQATMEQAELAMKRLGDSAAAGASNLDKLGTALTNIRDDIGQGLNAALNEAAGSAMNLFDIMGKIREYGFQNVVNAANGITLGSTTRADLQDRIALQQDTQQIYDSIVRDFNGGANSQFILDFVVAALQKTRESPELKNNTAELARTVMMELVQSGKTYEDANSDLAVTMATGVIQIQATNDALRAQKQAAMDAAASFYTTDEAYAPAVPAHVDLNKQNRVAAMKRAMDAAKTTYAETMNNLYSGVSGGLGTAFMYQGGLNAGLASPLGTPLTTMQNLTNLQTGSMPDFMRPEQAEALALAYSDAQAKLEELKRLNEEGLITDDQLQNAKTLTDNIGKMADEAQRAADNLQNMKLPDAFGQTSGGMAGQIGNDVIENMKKSGKYTDAEIQAAQRQFGLASGQETAASVVYEDDVKPLIQDILDTYGADAAAQAALNVQTYLQNAKLQGLSPGEIAKNLPNATGYSYQMGAGAGQSFTLKPGQTLSEISAQTGIPVAQLLGATGAQSANVVQPGTYQVGGNVAPIQGFNPGTYGAAPGLLQPGSEGTDTTDVSRPYLEMADATDNVKTNFTEINTQMDDLGSKASAFNESLDLASKAREMTFTVNLKDNTKGFLDLVLNSQKLGILQFDTGGTNGSIRDNGGRVPTIDGRVGQKPVLGGG